MRTVLIVAGLLAASAALAQSPQSVPLGGKAPDAESTSGRTTARDSAPAATGATTAAPGARNVPNGQVAPPSSINSGVQVIAPERK